MGKKICVYTATTFALIFIIFQFYAIFSTVFSEKEVMAEVEKSIVIRQGSEEDNRIAFTCNVDWGSEVIPDMLEIFKDDGIRITFFISGRWAENNPDLLRRIFVEGHEIQNHGYGHRMSSKISESEVLEEIKKTESAIMNLTGVKTNVFAPPSGDHDERTIQICKNEGYILSLWSVDTIDWRPGSTAEIIKNRVFNKKLNGAILLMHPKEETAKALPDIISRINKKGLSIVTFSELANQNLAP